MAEPFKNELGEARIKVIALHLSKQDEHFNKKQFLSIATENLAELSLMERNRQIVEALKVCLPNNFKQAQKIILKSLSPLDKQQDEFGLHSWLSIPLAEYVGQQGQENLPLAMTALSRITPFFSSEFAIRHLLTHHQAQSLEILHAWCEHKDEHVRRLASEGSRPRLPWGMQLVAFKNDPKLTFPLLEKLKNDESDYVRLSVSNHLNDISKDHPDWLIKQLKTWWQPDDAKRCKLIRHACRGLIKQGHKETLAMLGFKAFKIKDVNFELQSKSIKYGDSLNFNLQIEGPANKDIIVDYAIHFQKANGELKPKVFKWKVGKLDKNGYLKAKKKHAIKPITTRRYYNGAHKIEVLVNGMSVIEHNFQLQGVKES